MNSAGVRHPLNSRDWLYLGLVLLVILSIAYLLPVDPNDYWWYLRIGGEILKTGAIPVVDSLSYTQFGQPVLYHSWLSAVLFAKIFQLGGISLTVLVRGVVIALAYGMVFVLSRKAGAGTLIASLVTLLAALATSNNWTVRPQMFTYLLFAGVMWILYDWQKAGTKRIWLLPFISLLWVNLHGSFVIALVLVGGALIFGTGKKKDLVIAFGLSLLATLINPHGVGAWKYVLMSLTTASNQQYSMEWSPPLNLGWQMQLFFGWVLLFIPLAVLSKRKMTKLEWVWLMVFGWLAFSGQRYVIWFIFILSIVTGSLLADLGNLNRDVPGRQGVPKLNFLLGTLFIVMPLVLLPGIRSAWWSNAPENLADTPVEATTWLSDHPNIPGPIWSEIGFSSYLEYALPARPVWNDTRFELYPISQWERYKMISKAGWNWQATLDDEGIYLLMISRKIQPDLLQAVFASREWVQIYEDDVTVIFKRSGNP